MYHTAVLLVEKLQKAGHTAYFAGGCVRDMLLKKEPKDYDIVTSALPEEVETLLPKTIPVGKKFGVLIAVEGEHHFEIATFRSDSGYSDGRRPDYVTFTSPEEDAKRRDFTINGMFYDPIAQQLIDFVEGARYLDFKVIHFIGDPLARIQEDHLRILRAVRFAHQIGGQYHPDTYTALKSSAHLIADVSKERIKEELDKILESPTRAQAFEDLQDLGILQVILPEVELLKGVAQPLMYHREGSVWAHAMRSLRALGKNPSSTLAWAVLLHDIGKPGTFAMEERIRFDGHAELSAEIASRILTRLAFPKKEREKIIWAVEHHMMLLNVLDMPLAKQKKWILHPYFDFLLSVHRADALGASPRDLSGYKAVKKLVRKIKKSLPKKIPMYITGEDVMELTGSAPGPLVGELLEEVREAQLAGKIPSRQRALTYLALLWKRRKKSLS